MAEGTEMVALSATNEAESSNEPTETGGNSDRPTAGRAAPKPVTITTVNSVLVVMPDGHVKKKKVKYQLPAEEEEQAIQAIKGYSASPALNAFQIICEAYLFAWGLFATTAYFYQSVFWFVIDPHGSNIGTFSIPFMLLAHLAPALVCFWQPALIFATSSHWLVFGIVPSILMLFTLFDNAVLRLFFTAFAMGSLQVGFLGALHADSESPLGSLGHIAMPVALVCFQSTRIVWGSQIYTHEEGFTIAKCIGCALAGLAALTLRSGQVHLPWQIARPPPESLPMFFSRLVQRLPREGIASEAANKEEGRRVAAAWAARSSRNLVPTEAMAKELAAEEAAEAAAAQEGAGEGRSPAPFLANKSSSALGGVQASKSVFWVASDAQSRCSSCFGLAMDPKAVFGGLQLGCIQAWTILLLNNAGAILRWEGFGPFPGGILVVMSTAVGLVIARFMPRLKRFLSRLLLSVGLLASVALLAELEKVAGGFLLVAIFPSLLQTCWRDGQAFAVDSSSAGFQLLISGVVVLLALAATMATQLKADFVLLGRVLDVQMRIVFWILAVVNSVGLIGPVYADILTRQKDKYQDDEHDAELARLDVEDLAASLFYGGVVDRDGPLLAGQEGGSEEGAAAEGADGAEEGVVKSAVESADKPAPNSEAKSSAKGSISKGRKTSDGTGKGKGGSGGGVVVLKNKVKPIELKPEAKTREHVGKSTPLKARAVRSQAYRIQSSDRQKAVLYAIAVASVYCFLCLVTRGIYGSIRVTRLPPPLANTFTIGTYNTLLGYDSAGMANGQCVADVLLQRDPDLVVIQNSDSTDGFEGNRCQLDYLQWANFAFVLRAFTSKVPTFGVGMYARTPRAGVGLKLPKKNAVLSLDRIAVIDTFAVGGEGTPTADIRIVGVHTDPENPTQQIQFLLDHIASLESAGDVLPTIIIGDFNVEPTGVSIFNETNVFKPLLDAGYQSVTPLGCATPISADVKRQQCRSPFSTVHISQLCEEVPCQGLQTDFIFFKGGSLGALTVLATEVDAVRNGGTDHRPIFCSHHALVLTRFQFGP